MRINLKANDLYKILITPISFQNLILTLNGLMF